MVSAEILNSHPISTLKKEISKTNLKGYSKMKKPELVAIMMKNQSKFGHIKKLEKAKKVSAPKATATKATATKATATKVSTPKATATKVSAPKATAPKAKAPPFPDLGDIGMSSPYLVSPELMGVKERQERAISDIDRNEIAPLQRAIEKINSEIPAGQNFPRFDERRRRERLEENIKRFEGQRNWYIKHYVAWNNEQNIPEPLTKSNLSKLKTFLNHQLDEDRKKNYSKSEVKKMVDANKMATKLTNKKTKFTQTNYNQFYNTIEELMKVLKVNPLK
jgi:hypothetical protein